MKFIIIWAGLAGLVSCVSNASRQNSNDGKMKSFETGTYGYDVAFFQKNNVEYIELAVDGSAAKVLIVPGLQGRVMTSTADDDEGKSFGWINYDHFKSGQLSEQFNPFGGEERLWLGPEGGPFSIYFRAGSEQIFANWVVPKELDTEAFKIVEQSLSKALFQKNFSIENASGTTMNIGIQRSVEILSKENTEQALGIPLNKELSFVAFESVNTLSNRGTNDWNATDGVLSLWMLCMFNPSEQGIVFIPYKTGSVDELGKIVTDNYFGDVPKDRLIVKDGTIFFKVDGKFRSKIGVPPLRAMPFCGSYDPVTKVLTLLWYSSPEIPGKYVNSVWGEQEDPLSGDVVNSYNDGPTDDGSVMGPFFEIESSSPAAMLKSGENLTHTQRIFHITGDEKYLTEITESLFNLSIDEIKAVF